MSSTFSLSAQLPTSEQQQCRPRDFLTDDGTKRDVVDLTSRRRQEHERKLIEQEGRVIDDNRCEDERKIVRNSGSDVPRQETEIREEEKDKNVNKGYRNDSEDVEMVTT